MRYSNLKIILILWLGIDGGRCSIFFKEDKVCDPSGMQLSTFSGFKVYREYMLKDLRPPMLHFVALSHCSDGTLDYERLVTTDRETDINWETPFCFMDPQIVKKELSFPINIKKPLEIDHAPKRPHSVNPKKLNQKRTPKDKFKLFLKKILFKVSLFDNTDDWKLDVQNLRTLANRNISQSLDHLTCYKLARRKKYAQRNLMIYAPHTFVGGIFKCKVSGQDREDYLHSLKGEEGRSKPFEFKCDSKTAVPLYPLLSDDTSQQWVEKLKGVTILQRVPYLYSPSSLDFRYGKPAQLLGLKGNVTNDEIIVEQSVNQKPFDSWFREIDVNENYNYTENDINLVTKAVTNTVNILKEFLRINPKYLPWEWGDDNFAQNKQSLTHLEYKVLAIFSNMRNSTQIKDFTKSLQSTWDYMNLSSENFHYHKISE